MTLDVAVVGGGVAGLAAAHRLVAGVRGAGRSLDLAVLEAAPRAGGHAWTTREQGFLVEAGPNAWLARSEDRHLAELVRELGLESRRISASAVARRRYVFLRGRLQRAPDSPFSLLASGALSWSAKLRILLEPWSRPARRGVEETVHAFARRHFGAEAAENLVDAAVAGVTAGDSRRLSAEASFPRLVEMERDHGSLIRASMARRRRDRPRLTSFDGGMGTLIEALGSRLGDALRFSCPVRRVARATHGWALALENGQTLRAAHVILAVPAHQAATLLRDFDSRLADSLDAFPFAGLAVVALAYREADVPRALDGYGYLVAPSEKLRTLGAVWESSLFAGRAPAGAVLLRVMLGGVRHPEMAALDEAELVFWARRELAIVLGITQSPLSAWVRRWPRAIAQYEVGHLARVAEVRARIAHHPGLELCGSSFGGMSFVSAVASGAEAGREILTRLQAREAAAESPLVSEILGA
jgi:oxygen-dependent protoporphyrinogen oxidase